MTVTLAYIAKGSWDKPHKTQLMINQHKFSCWMLINCCPVRQHAHIGSNVDRDVKINDITMTSQWARWRHKSPALRLFAQPFIQNADQRKHQSSASLAFERGIHRWPVNSPQKGPATWKMFPFDDVIMHSIDHRCLCTEPAWFEGVHKYLHPH